VIGFRDDSCPRYLFNELKESCDPDERTDGTENLQNEFQLCWFHSFSSSRVGCNFFKSGRFRGWDGREGGPGELGLGAGGWGLGAGGWGLPHYATLGMLLDLTSSCDLSLCNKK